jgi:mRNA interferase RelE/StbE
MKTVFLASFLRDVKRLRDGRVQRAVASAISNVELADSIDQIRGLKRLSGHGNYYRIRVGDWRLELMIRGDVARSSAACTGARSIVISHEGINRYERRQVNGSASDNQPGY